MIICVLKMCGIGYLLLKCINAKDLSLFNAASNQIANAVEVHTTHSHMLQTLNQIGNTSRLH